MAGDTEVTEVYRSGGIYLLRRGKLARVVSPGRKPGQPVLYLSALAHVHVSEPWALVGPGDDLPQPVRDAAESADGWDPPDWLGG